MNTWTIQGWIYGMDKMGQIHYKIHIKNWAEFDAEPNFLAGPNHPHSHTIVYVPLIFPKIWNVIILLNFYIYIYTKLSWHPTNIKVCKNNCFTIESYTKSMKFQSCMFLIIFNVNGWTFHIRVKGWNSIYIYRYMVSIIILFLFDLLVSLSITRLKYFGLRLPSLSPVVNITLFFETKNLMPSGGKLHHL